MTKSWIYGILSTDAGLIAAVGSDDNVTDIWPEVINTFPMVIYIDDNQSDMEYSDNRPMMSRQRFVVHIFTKLDGPTTSTIGAEVYRIFSGLFFNCGSNGEVPDETEGVRHRVMRFSRELFASDI
jgi:hypothetical protein